MNKLIFSTVPMRSNIQPMVYKPVKNSSLKYASPVVFPVNAVLAASLKPEEKVKIVLMTKDDVNGDCKRNAEVFKHELGEINKDIGALITYEIIDSPFEESSNVHEDLFRRLIDSIDARVEIITDITYGPKPLSLVLFCTLQFAEKFFDADIKRIVYGKVDFVDAPGSDQRQAKNGELYDITPLYHLNAFTNSLQGESGQDAIKAIDTFFAL